MKTVKETLGMLIEKTLQDTPVENPNLLEIIMIDMDSFLSRYIESEVRNDDSSCKPVNSRQKCSSKPKDYSPAEVMKNAARLQIPSRDIFSIKT